MAGGGNETVCDCGQVRKNIILIGGTGNGKSSLVKSILKYAGDVARSDTVVEGNGNVSQTQSVSSYPVNVDLRPHYLEDNAGNSVDMAHNLSVRAQASLRYREGEPKDHLHLNILDTPGLDDTGNLKTATALFKNRVSDELSTLNVLDEQHKLSIMTAVLNAGSINVVCFVIKLGASYGETVQKQFRACINIFKKSGLNVAYRVVHTTVSPEERLKKDLPEREKEFSKLFSVPAQHHFVDSDPDPKMAVEVYCSRMAVDDLLQSFNKTKRLPIQDIRYPKSEPHMVADENYLLSIDLITSSLRKQIQLLKERLAENHVRIMRSRTELDTCNEYFEQKEAQITDHESTDLVTLEPVHRDEKPGGWIMGATLEFDWQGSIIIRDIEQTYTSPETKYTRCSGKGTTRLQARLVAEMWKPAKAIITLKVFKRDLFEEELKRWRKDLATIKAERKQITDELNSIEDECCELRMRVLSFGFEIEALEKEKLKMEEDSVSLDKSRHTCMHFTVCNVIGMSLAYQFTQEASRFFLQDSRILEDDTLKLLFHEERRQRDMLRTNEFVLSALTMDAQQKLNTCRYLEGMLKIGHASLKSEGSSIKPEYKNSEFWKVAFSNQSTEVRPHIEDLQLDLKERSRILDNALVESQERELNCATELCECIKQALLDLKVLREENTKERNKWGVSRQTCKTAIAAIEETIKVCKSSRIPLGAFTFLRIAMERPDAGAMNPYMQLYHEIVIAYTIRDNTDNRAFQKETPIS